MGQPESKLAVHPVVVVGDGDGDGAPPSPLQNVTASSRAAASGGSFSAEKKGGRSPSVEDDGVGDEDEDDDDEDDAEAAERAIRAIVDAQGWEVTRLDPAVLDEVNNYYGFAGGRTTRGWRSAEKAAETSADGSAADNAEGADGALTRGAAAQCASPVSSGPDALATAATTAADASASASLVQRIDRFLFPPPKVSFHEFSQSASAAAGPQSQEETSMAEAADGGVGQQRSLRRWRRSDSAPASSGAGTAAPAAPTATLLWGADSQESHERIIRDALASMKGRRGAEGLRAAGFEFRRVLCGRHADGAAGGADCVDGEEEGGTVALEETEQEEEEGTGNDVERAKEAERGEGSHSEIEARGWGRQRSISDGDAAPQRRRQSSNSPTPSAVGPGRRRRRSFHGDGGEGARKRGGDDDDEGADVADSGSEVKPPRGRSQSDPLCSSHHRRDSDTDLEEEDRYGGQRRRRPPWTEIVPTTTTKPVHGADDVMAEPSAAVHERRSTRAGEFGVVDRDRYESGASSLETVDCGNGDKGGVGVGVDGCAETNLMADGESDGGDVNKDVGNDAQAGAHGKNPLTDNVIGAPQGNDSDHRHVDDGFGSDHRSSSLCAECVTRLHHIPSSAVITPENRSRYIADGEMYDEIARLCQEYVHDLMAEEGNLEWVTVCDDKRRGEPVRALVDREHQFPPDKNGSVDVRREGRDDLETLVVDDQRAGSVQSEGVSNHAADTAAQALPKRTRPTLLIVTGKGKVRAGVFSRSHLLSSGIEPSTALPMVREARRRGMAVVLLDPNARGDRKGMETFELSVEALFGSGQDTHGEELDVDFPSAAGGAKDEAKGSETGHDPQSGRHRRHSHRRHHHNPMYILAYSASGGQLVRYLMDASNPFLNRIRAIAFTDSTHNFQWTRNDPRLSSLLESPSCVYVRSANARRDGLGKSRTYRAGEEVRTDHYWRRRFGTVRTVWAGTAVHELANWAAHAHIWEHFDRHHSVRHLLQRDGGHGGSKAEEEEEEGSDDRSAAPSGAEPRGSRRFRSRDFGAITV